MKGKITASSLLFIAIMMMFLMPVGFKNSIEKRASIDSDSNQSTINTTVTGTVKTTSNANSTVTTTTTLNQTTTTTSNQTTTTTPTPTTVDTTTTKAQTDKKPVVNPPSPNGSASVNKPTENKPAENKPAGTPVSAHGQLSVKGADIVDQKGNKFQLLGMSTHGIGWFPDIISKSSFKTLRDDWGCNAIRLAMYIEEIYGGSESCYLADKTRNKNLIINGIEHCLELDMYVIVDWHVLNPGNPTTHTADAKAFFGEIAKNYGNKPNIIYELCNEPNGNSVTWANQIKPYCEEVIKEIRKYDPDAIIVCGTGTWSQDIDKVIGNTVSDKNTVYALHFYADTHRDDLRQRLQSCYNKGLPVLVTEFGTCDASGNNKYNSSETQKWFDLMDKLNVGYFNWSLSNKSETASVFTSGTKLSDIKAGTSQLTESGKLIRAQLRKRAGL